MPQSQSAAQLLRQILTNSQVTLAQFGGLSYHQQQPIGMHPQHTGRRGQHRPRFRMPKAHGRMGHVYRGASQLAHAGVPGMADLAYTLSRLTALEHGIGHFTKAIFPGKPQKQLSRQQQRLATMPIRRLMPKVMKAAKAAGGFSRKIGQPLSRQQPPGFRKMGSPKPPPKPKPPPVPKPAPRPTPPSLPKPAPTPAPAPAPTPKLRQPTPINPATKKFIKRPAGMPPLPDSELLKRKPKPPAPAKPKKAKTPAPTIKKKKPAQAKKAAQAAPGTPAPKVRQRKAAAPKPERPARTAAELRAERQTPRVARGGRTEVPKADQGAPGGPQQWDDLKQSIDQLRQEVKLLTDVIKKTVPPDQGSKPGGIRVAAPRPRDGGGMISGAFKGIQETVGAVRQLGELLRNIPPGL